MGAVPSTRGQWLRDQRQARGWNIPDMSRELRAAAAGHAIVCGASAWAVAGRAQVLSLLCSEPTDRCSGWLPKWSPSAAFEQHASTAPITQRILLPSNG
jgi:hypothetical protein